MVSLFFFNDTATTEIYTLSLHDALPIWPFGPTPPLGGGRACSTRPAWAGSRPTAPSASTPWTSGDRKKHTSELQSRQYLVCRLLLEKQTSPTSTAGRSSCTAPSSPPAPG